MKPKQILTVGIPPELEAAVRDLAAELGLSVSYTSKLLWLKALKALKTDPVLADEEHIVTGRARQ